MADGQGGGIIKAALEFIGQHIGFIWFVIVSAWGGTVAYLDKVRRHGRAFRFLELVGEWLTSGFAGLMVAYICTEAGLSFAVSAVMAGMAGNMSSHALTLIRRWAVAKLPGNLGDNFDRRDDDKSDRE